MKTSLGDRMKKNYEDRYKFKLTRRMPAIIRLDGKAFHTLTKRCIKPFDDGFSNSIVHTMLMLLGDIQGAKCGYQQSDEISILITDYDTLQTDAWFDYNVQKIASVTAGYASAVFTTSYCYDGNFAVFDGRVFNIPKEEVCNYFIWRQKDWLRNSIQMLGRSYFSHKQMYKKNNTEVQDMLYEKGINWNDLESKWKNGVFIYWTDCGFKAKDDIIFAKKRDIIENLLIPKET